MKNPEAERRSIGNKKTPPRGSVMIFLQKKWDGGLKICFNWQKEIVCLRPLTTTTNIYIVFNKDSFKNMSPTNKRTFKFSDVVLSVE